MPLVCFASPKGGVGKTTLTATVGLALQRLGWRVLAIDLDRQNALRLHFELSSDDLPGIADESNGRRDWSDLVVETRSGVYLIPFGAAPAAHCLRLERFAGENPGWIRGQLEPFFEHRDLVLVLDMPSGPSSYGVAIDPIADLQVAVLLADPLSLALLPRMQARDFLVEEASNRFAPVGFVVNQVDPRRQLCRDVVALTRDTLGEELYGAVHFDDAVAEAAACQLTVLDYAPESVASRDIESVADRVHRSLTQT